MQHPERLALNGYAYVDCFLALLGGLCPSCRLKRYGFCLLVGLVKSMQSSLAHVLYLIGLVR